MIVLLKGFGIVLGGLVLLILSIYLLCIIYIFLSNLFCPWKNTTYIIENIFEYGFKSYLIGFIIISILGLSYLIGISL